MRGDKNYQLSYALPNPISTFASHAHYFPFPRNCDASNKAIAISFPAFPAGTPHTAPPLTVGATVTPFLLLCHRDPSPAPPGSGSADEAPPAHDPSPVPPLLTSRGTRGPSHPLHFLLCGGTSCSSGRRRRPKLPPLRRCNLHPFSPQSQFASLLCLLRWSHSHACTVAIGGAKMLFALPIEVSLRL